MHNEWIKTQKSIDNAINYAREQRRQYENASRYLALLRKEIPQNKEDIQDQIKYFYIISSKYKSALQDIAIYRSQLLRMESNKYVISRL